MVYACILALGKLRQEDLKFGGSPGYLETVSKKDKQTEKGGGTKGPAKRFQSPSVLCPMTYSSWAVELRLEIVQMPMGDILQVHPRTGRQGSGTAFRLSYRLPV